MKPQLRSTSSRAPSSLCLMIGAMCPGKIAGSVSNMVMRLSERRNLRARSMRLVLMLYKLHIVKSCQLGRRVARLPEHGDGAIHKRLLARCDTGCCSCGLRERAGPVSDEGADSGC